MELEEIVTLDQLVAALDQLRLDRGFSLRDLAAAARKLPPQGGRQRTLPSSTASDVIHARSVPKHETVVTWRGSRW
ncbi:hypothetical protein ED92_38420 [Amycolatopsis sp. MJM2582]|nr:hypothetical protein ED92_38420 [Amycolatopsis sp. MJM2582]